MKIMAANNRDLPAQAPVIMLAGDIERARGASRRFIVAMILQESVNIYGLVALLGICVGEIMRNITTTKIPTLYKAA